MTLRELMKVTDANVEVIICGMPNEVTGTVRYACPADVIDDDASDGLTVVEVEVTGLAGKLDLPALWVKVAR